MSVCTLIVGRAAQPQAASIQISNSGIECGLGMLQVLQMGAVKLVETTRVIGFRVAHAGRFQALRLRALRRDSGMTSVGPVFADADEIGPLRDEHGRDDQQRQTSPAPAEQQRQQIGAERNHATHRTAKRMPRRSRFTAAQRR